MFFLSSLFPLIFFNLHFDSAALIGHDPSYTLSSSSIQLGSIALTVNTPVIRLSVSQQVWK